MLRLLLAVALLGAPASKRRAEWNGPQQPFRIIGNIYYAGTAGLGSYLITGPQGAILLDGALPESAPQIEQHIRQLGHRLQDVKILLNSHAHYDHAGGLPQIKRDTGAQMAASAGDAHDLESGLTESFGAGWDERNGGVKVDRIIHDGDTVQLGTTVLTAHVTPGHTRGCTTWTTTAMESGHTYNVVFYCSTSVPGYKLKNNKYYPEIASDYERSFAVLRRLPCEVFLANHTEVFHMQEKLRRVKAGAPNPFIDPAEMSKYVQQSYADFQEALNSAH